MQDVCGSDERYCGGQEIRENSGIRGRREGGGLFPGGKNRDEAERRRCEAACHRSEEFRENLSCGSVHLARNAHADDAPTGTGLAARGRAYRGGSNYQRAAVTSRRRIVTFCLFLLV